MVILRVAEANARDVGRGIVRIDPQDMEKIDVEVGDVVQVEGKRKTVAKIMPTFPKERGKSLARMDGIVRNNAQISLDEDICVQKTLSYPAEKAVLIPLTRARSFLAEGDDSYISTLLSGIAMVEGDVVRANLLGTRSRDFLVGSTVPKGPVLFYPKTMVVFKKGAEGEFKKPEISYEDIGGLSKALQKVREMIELPLKCPKLFERLGIDPPKGVLLYGPPGCGKTLIARAVANETAAYFVHITGPEIMGKFYGESEARLRAVFEEAKKNAPAILFIDEIDAIAPKREEMGGEKQVERRVVAQLLALMDGLESRGEVIVIGATNIPNSLDPALRRPGRFDRELEIAIPNQRGRLEVLQIHTRGMPLAINVDLEKLSRVTHGFVGADLEALCREAAMSVLRRIMPHVDYRIIEESTNDTLLNIEVTMDDFQEALKDIEPSAIREVFVEIPNVRWEDVGGLRDVRSKLTEAVEWPLKYEELFGRLRLQPVKGVLLSGPPGVGKTMVAKAIANESGVNFISVKGPELLSKYIGESEKGVREVFRKARQANPCILFFDEFDALVPARRSHEDSQVTERVISQFLTELDGIEELKGVLVLAATNREDLIDPAVLRPGRFDFILRFALPGEEERLEILKVHCKGKPLASDVRLEDLLGVTNGFSASDLQSLCQEASRCALREFLSSEGNMELAIRRCYFDQALEKILEQKK